MVHLQPTIDQRFLHVDISDAILAELSSNLGHLRLEANMVFPALEDNLTVAFRSETKRHETLGNYCETNTVTPMACKTRQTADILWQCLAQSNEGADNSCHFVNRDNPDQNKVNSTVKLCDGLLMLDAVCVFHRYDEGEQTVLVGTTTWTFPTGGLEFEGHHWTVISPSLSNPSYSSVAQSCYKLQTKVTDAASILPADLESARDLVMSTVGKKMYSAMQLLQNALLSHVDLGPCLLEVH